jgi:hypothetical protein
MKISVETVSGHEGKFSNIYWPTFEADGDKQKIR